MKLTGSSHHPQCAMCCCTAASILMALECLLNGITVQTGGWLWQHLLFGKGAHFKLCRLKSRDYKWKSTSICFHFTYISVCIFLSFWVLFSFSLICTLPLLAYHWQEIDGSFFLTSHLKLGVSLQFPLLKKTSSVCSLHTVHVSHMQHTDFTSDTGRELQLGQVHLAYQALNLSVGFFVSC